MLSFLYRLLTDCGAPLISAYLARRLATGREDKDRFQERLGIASQPRPLGPVLWCHAASVGEAASLLTLIKRLLVLHSEYSILITTGTVTSALLLKERLPPHVIHQYIPVDRYTYITRFLDHWRPDRVLWIESELWPNLLSLVHKRQIPAILLNGRMSNKSYRHWSYVKEWARSLLATFDLCLTQTDDEKHRFSDLGARAVECVGNLKFAAQALPYDEVECQKLQDVFQGRALWLAASTHRGEEEIIISTHKKVKEIYPDLLTIIVPRHAVRGADVATLIESAGLSYARRSKGHLLTPTTDIYLADTMGELGLFYRLASLVVIGGSFVPVGGHNPIEPAQIGAVIIFGPYMFNFRAIADEFIAEKAAVTLHDEQALAPLLIHFLSSLQDQKNYQELAHNLAERKRYILDLIIKKIEPWLTSNSKNTT